MLAGCRRLGTRRAGTVRALSFTSRRSSDRLTFPTSRNPTPYQIFHLPQNASQADVKARCLSLSSILILLVHLDTDYDLVRLYHPDKADPSVAPEVAHARFQSITIAYDQLRGKRDMPATAPKQSTHPTAAAHRAMHRHRHQHAMQFGSVDEKWKERLILGGIVFVRPSQSFVAAHRILIIVDRRGVYSASSCYSTGGSGQWCPKNAKYGPIETKPSCHGGSVGTGYSTTGESIASGRNMQTTL